VGKAPRIAIGLLAAAGLATTGMELWTRRPVPPPERALDVPADTSTLVLVTHGSADADDPLLGRVVTDLEARYRDIPGAAVRFLRWAPQSDERLRAAATAQATGRLVGAGLARLGRLRDLQLIAHSSGAFMPDAICQAYRTASAAPARVSMVLLDPFQIHGFVDWNWGARHHGECADFALAVINTDDPAPATNHALANAWNLDVTSAGKGFQPNGHYWPWSTTARRCYPSSRRSPSARTSSCRAALPAPQSRRTRRTSRGRRSWRSLHHGTSSPRWSKNPPESAGVRRSSTVSSRRAATAGVCTSRAFPA
jgi:hypothetical protein